MNILINIKIKDQFFSKTYENTTSFSKLFSALTTIKESKGFEKFLDIRLSTTEGKYYSFQKDDLSWISENICGCPYCRTRIRNLELIEK